MTFVPQAGAYSIGRECLEVEAVEVQFGPWALSGGSFKR